jgi:hypothetical protein
VFLIAILHVFIFNKVCCNKKFDRECVLYIIEAAAMYATRFGGKRGQ